jgi:hypothetical protein
MFNSLDEAIQLGDKKNETDGGVPVFELRAVPIVNKRKKEVEYEDVVWVTIFNKGDPKNIIERPMREHDKERWPKHWQAYLENKEPPIDGIPLEDFPQITPAERLRCKNLKIRSVEDLCNLPDAQLEQLGGRGHSLQKAAREYVAYREGVQVSDLMEQMEEKDDQIADLQKRLEELERGNSTASNTKRGTGNKSSKAKRSNGRGSGSGGKGVSDSEDSGEEAS